MYRLALAIATALCLALAILSAALGKGWLAIVFTLAFCVGLPLATRPKTTHKTNP